MHLNALSWSAGSKNQSTGFHVCCTLICKYCGERFAWVLSLDQRRRSAVLWIEKIYVLWYFYTPRYKNWSTHGSAIVSASNVQKPQSVEAGKLRVKFTCGVRSSESHSPIDVHPACIAAKEGGSFLRALCMFGRCISL